MRILMVCLGNICRSPLAEGILAEEILHQRLDWSVDSAGTSGWHAGELPDKRSINVAKQHKLDITSQRSRKIRATDIEDFDLILAMDRQNLQELKAYFVKDPHLHYKIRLISEFSNTFKDKDIPDPYYNNDGFEQVFVMLQDCIKGLLQTTHSIR